MWYCLSDICQSSGSFEFIKVSIIDTFWFLLENCMFLKYSCQKNLETNCELPVFLEELADCKKFFKGFPAF